MAYDTHFPKFGSQSKSKILTPVFYNARYRNPNIFIRAGKHFTTSLAGFAIGAVLFISFTSEWRVICENIPIYKKKFSSN